MTGYFFDSYAMFEIIFGNEEYVRRTNNAGFITAKIDLLELYYHLLLRHGEASADNAYAAFQEGSIEPNDEDIKEAAKFKVANKKLKLSYADCIGYAMAKRRGLKFLTGDKAFKGMENVEFVA